MSKMADHQTWRRSDARRETPKNDDPSKAYRLHRNSALKAKGVFTAKPSMGLRRQEAKLCRGHGRFHLSGDYWPRRARLASSAKQPRWLLRLEASFRLSFQILERRMSSFHLDSMLPSVIRDRGRRLCRQQAANAEPN